MSKRINFLKSVDKAFGDVPASYGTLIDLGKSDRFNHCIVYNNTNQEIIIKFSNTANDSSFTLGPGEGRAKDNFLHNGVVEYKYTTLVPNSGSVKIESW